MLYTHNLPYGSMLYMSDGAEVKKGDMICEWDPYNAVIISEHEGKAVYDSVIEGVTYRDERDEQTGLSEKVIIESKDKTKNPVIKVINKEGEEVKSYNLPVSAHVVVKDLSLIHILQRSPPFWLKKAFLSFVRSILSTTLPRRKSVVLRSTLRTLSTRLQIVTMHTLTARVTPTM